MSVHDCERLPPRFVAGPDGSFTSDPGLAHLFNTRKEARKAFLKSAMVGALWSPETGLFYRHFATYVRVHEGHTPEGANPID